LTLPSPHWQKPPKDERLKKETGYETPQIAPATPEATVTDEL
jgi:hypothetical protein